MSWYQNPLQQVVQGQQFVDNLFQQQAQRGAGAALARGDYSGGANALYRAGDIRGGAGVQQMGQQAQAQQQAATDQQRLQQLQQTQQIVQALKRARTEGQDTNALLQQYRPTFLAMGTNAQEYDQIAGMIGQDPNFLDQIDNVLGQQVRELSYQKAGDNLLVFEAGNPDPIRSFEAPRQPINVNGVLVDPQTYEPILDTRDPKYQTITNSDGTTSVIAIDQPAPIRGGGSGSGDVNSILDGIIRREGGFVARDGRSGAPANFGINQRANPDVDVANLTEGQARQIYQERYIQPIVEAGVSGPALEAVIDFGVNAGVGRSLDFWRRSGGDVNEFNRLRLQHYRSLPDYQQNGRSWERRVAETTPGQGEVQVGGGARIVAQGQNRGATPAQEAAAQARNFSQERQLRGEFGNNPAVKTLASVRPQVQIIGQIAERARRGEQINAADDLALIFSYMKMLDPGSVVREGEFANAQNTAGIPERVVNAYNNALNGTRLSNEQRNSFFQSATGVMQAYQQDYDAAVNRTRELAQSYGLDADRIARAPAPQQRRRAPEWTTPAQIEASRRMGATGARGSQTNPILINPNNPRQSLNNVRPGQWYLTPDGEPLRRGSR